ncbi:MAG: hypothetical protein ACRDN9_01935 [Streptosporangiaceae bacterium]
MADWHGDRLRLDADLRELGHRLDVPPAPDCSRAVRTRLEAPAHAGWSRRLAAAAAVLIVLCVAVAASPEVRASVAELFRFAGVEISTGPAPKPHGAGGLPGRENKDLAEARDLATFPVYAPAGLGTPDKVTVSGGRPPRVVSLIYRAGPGRPSSGSHGVAGRLDEFNGTIGPVLRKWVSVGEVHPVRVDGHRGMWTRGPHEVAYVDRHGQWHTASARLAGNTLIWQVGKVTLRLEGHFTRNEAIEVARSIG